MGKMGREEGKERKAKGEGNRCEAPENHRKPSFYHTFIFGGILYPPLSPI